MVLKFILSDHLYSMMSHVYSGGSGLFKYDNAPIYGAQEVTEWLHEYQSEVVYIMWPSQSPD